MPLAWLHQQLKQVGHGHVNTLEACRELDHTSKIGFAGKIE